MKTAKQTQGTKIEWRRLADVTPYENNPRKNAEAIGKVAASIQEFGFRQPILVDKDGTFIAGHTRLEAARRIGMNSVPVIVCDDLDPEHVKALRLADNKTAEFSEWDIEALANELAAIDIDMSGLGFEISDDWFKSGDKGEATHKDSEEYKQFLEKFEDKHTTDDCYTPEKVYNAVVDWVANEYKVDKSLFVRPFYPGGDYQKEVYKKGDIVVDNPPFSILAEIIRWYQNKGIKFFLFGPAQTIFSSASNEVACICVGPQIIYANGANVPTSFVTNLEPEEIRARTAPTLYAAVDKANRETQAETKTEMPSYQYPPEIMTASMLSKYSRYGVDFSVTKAESVQVDAMDAQKQKGKAIFGTGFLLSEKAAAEKAAAEKAAATSWILSEREKQIVKELSGAK